MSSYQVTFPNQQTLVLPAKTVAAIAQAKAKYATPLWQFRAERVLKLGAHQWIYPSDVATARLLLGASLQGIQGGTGEGVSGGIMATAWKLFNRGWLGAGEAYFMDTLTYPNQPRHWGQQVIPLVDEELDSAAGSQQIGWVRMNQSTPMDNNFAVFVQFTLLDLFTPRLLPVEYR